MGIFRRLVKTLAILILFLILLFLGLTKPTWPSKARLCQDLANYLPRTECMRMKNALEIVQRAFTEGDTSSDEVKSALGDYLHAEYSTAYGHREVYRLSVRPIDYLFNYFDAYDFRYDENGVLISFSYDDF